MMFKILFVLCQLGALLGLAATLWALVYAPHPAYAFIPFTLTCLWTFAIECWGFGHPAEVNNDEV